MGKDNRDVADRLKTLSKKKVDTTMIGALSVVEEKLGKLWNHPSKHRTKDEEEWHKLYEEIRSKILDLGNNQKRKLDEEFEYFNIDVRVIHYDMQVKPRPTGRTENEGN